MKNIWEPDGLGSPEPGSSGEIKYQQTSTRPCTTTDLEVDGLHHVRKLTNISFTLTYFPRFTNIKLSKLSKINRDKFFLCRELLRNPSVIFFDQSSIHQQTESLLRNLKQISNLGKTVVCTLEMSSFRSVPFPRFMLMNININVTVICQETPEFRQNIVAFPRKAGVLRYYFRSDIRMTWWHDDHHVCTYIMKALKV